MECLTPSQNGLSNFCLTALSQQDILSSLTKCAIMMENEMLRWTKRLKNFKNSLNKAT